MGEIRYLNPPADAMETLEEIAAIEFAVVTNKSAEAVRSLLQVAGVASVAVEPLERRRTPAAAPAEARPAEPGVKPAETLRVDIERLDELMNLAGQLVIGKARITQISDRLKKSVGEKDFADARDGVGDLFEAIHLLDRISDGIQQGVMNMRMLPIGPLFSRFHRVIRDLTRANGKEIRLEISGEGTELDKRMIDELGDPMIHIIRNAADHGIESPRGPPGGRKAPLRHHQALRLPSRQQHHHPGVGRRARTGHRPHPREGRRAGGRLGRRRRAA